jgi:hypothetical protein
MRDGYQRKMKVIFIAREASCDYSNGRRFGSRASTRVRHFENHVSCVSYPDDQVNYSSFQRNVHRDVMAMQLTTCVLWSRQCVSKHIINPVRHRVRLVRRLKIEGNMKLNSGTRCMKSSLNGDV